MSLQESEVRKVAGLANLILSDEEVASFGEDLNAIVTYIEQLQEVDVSGVLPVVGVSGIETCSRTDEPQPALPREQILAMAPQANEQAFLVPKAVNR
ncbi:MAG: Asp-tRNA(Asn)/Glu-tRNA(Gln) amidotransferase subunit GatC [Planctomycetota bacterium]|nr:MAG: Asp-tRNA(Asn)/Glu-tRNA(Gln) amidotransferase subunit GatC [Planctomycetota bacterium]